MTGLPRIGLNRGCPQSSAPALQEKGWDVVHISDIGMGRATDAEIVGRGGITVGYADSSGRFERDHACVTLLSVWPRITDARSSVAAVTINTRDVRIRKLPIR